MQEELAVWRKIQLESVGSYSLQLNCGYSLKKHEIRKNTKNAYESMRQLCSDERTSNYVLMIPLREKVPTVDIIDVWCTANLLRKSEFEGAVKRKRMKRKRYLDHKDKFFFLSVSSHSID